MAYGDPLKIWSYYLVDSMDAKDACEIPYPRFRMHSYDEDDAAVAAAKHAYNQDPSDTKLDYCYEMVLVAPDGMETRWGISHTTQANVTHNATRQQETKERI